MERTWYVVAVAKIAVIFRGIFISPRQRFYAYMSDKEMENLKDDIEIVEYRERKDFPVTTITKSEPIIEGNSKGEENGTLSNRENKGKNKTKVSKPRN